MSRLSGMPRWLDYHIKTIYFDSMKFYPIVTFTFLFILCQMQPSVAGPKATTVQDAQTTPFKPLTKLIRKIAPGVLKGDFSILLRTKSAESAELSTAVQADTKIIEVPDFAPAAHASEDELAYAAIRVLFQHKFPLEAHTFQNELSALNHFIFETAYNPMAAVAYYESMTRLNKKGTELYSKFQAARVLAKERISQAALQEIDLSKRLQNFESLAAHKNFYSLKNRMAKKMGLSQDAYYQLEQQLRQTLYRSSLLLVKGVAWAAALAAVITGAAIARSGYDYSVLKFYKYVITPLSNFFAQAAVIAATHAPAAAIQSSATATWGYVKSISFYTAITLVPVAITVSLYNKFSVVDEAEAYKAEKIKTFSEQLSKFQKAITVSKKDSLGKIINIFDVELLATIPSAYFREYTLPESLGNRFNSLLQTLIKHTSKEVLQKKQLARAIGDDAISAETLLLWAREAGLEYMTNATLQTIFGMVEWYPSNYEIALAYSLLTSSNYGQNWNNDTIRSAARVLKMVNSWGDFIGIANDGLAKVYGEKCKLFLNNAPVDSASFMQGHLCKCLKTELQNSTSPGMDLKILNLLMALDENEEWLSQQYQLVLNSFSNVSDFFQLFEEHQSTSTSRYSMGLTFGRALVQKPELIRTERDIALVLDNSQFWSKTGSLIDSDINKYKTLKKLNREQNHYHIEQTELLHELLIRKFRTLKPSASASEKKTFWRQLVKRGSTVHSDAYFDKIELAYSDFVIDDLVYKIFDRGLKTKILRKVVLEGALYRNLLKQPSGLTAERKDTLTDIATLSEGIVGKGSAHSNLMETLAQDIQSDVNETNFIEELKKEVPKENGELIEDALKIFYEIIKSCSDFSLDDQWELIRYLTGHSKTFPQKIKTFIEGYQLTPLRLKGDFEALANPIRRATLDALLSHEHGLLSTINPSDVWTLKVLDHIVKQVEPKARTIVRDFLDAYMAALDTDSLKYFKSTFLAHLLSAGNTSDRAGQVLVRVCQYFGAYGIKIGQFLAASGLLPHEETKALQSLEDQARTLTRKAMFDDLHNILEERSPGRADKFGFRILNILGSASLKYVVEAEDKRTGARRVFKVLSKEAIFHTQMEQKILEVVADHLTKKDSSKYGIFRAAVHSAKIAIAKELSMEDEVKRSKRARQKLYATCASPHLTFSFMREKFLHPRLVMSEFAPGKSFHELSPIEKTHFAEELLSCEAENLRGSGKRLFDPDRHPGNFRILNGVAAPIDFGQLHEFNDHDYKIVVDFIAIANILSQVGEEGEAAVSLMGGPFISHLLKLLKIQKKSDGKLLAKLAKVFSKNSGEVGIAPYFRLLSKLESFALLENLKDEKRLFLYDLPKGIMQFRRYEEFIGKNKNFETPREVFSEDTEERAIELWDILAPDRPGTFEYIMEKLRWTFWASA